MPGCVDFSYMEPQFYGRCPNGDLTQDPQVYGKAWRELGEYCERMFPGFRVHGYDPEIHLSNGKHSFNLPVAAVMAMKSVKG